MSTAIQIGFFPDYSALNIYERRRNAVSSEAKKVEQDTSAVSGTIEHSQDLFGKKAEAISKLRHVVGECKEDDWDGCCAKATNPSVVLFAENFIRALPDDIPQPEFAPEPDGSISLDWIQTRVRIFSLSISSNNRLAYAWVDGADKGHAVAGFDGQKIPSNILHGIRSIMNLH